MDNVTLGTKQLEFVKDDKGNVFVDTGINVSLKDFCYFTEVQSSFDTINGVMNICDEFKKIYPNFTKSTDKLMSVFLSRMKELEKMIQDKYNVLLTDAGYTLSDIEDAHLVTAISYDTQNIILLKEDDK